MGKVIHVARDILREALARRWITRILIAISLLFLAVLLSLQLTIVDGVLATARLFGGDLHNKILPTDLALRPVFEGASYFLFFAGTMFGTAACSDFAPELLMPGRIEQLLALPLRRWQLIVGSYVGVLAIALLCTLYFAGLVTLLLGIKAGVWSASIAAGAFATLLAFTAIYGAMLLVSCVTHSASQATSIGLVVFGLALTITRPSFAAAFTPGWKRTAAQLATCWLPRLDRLSRVGPALAGIEPLEFDMLRAAASAIAFGLACVSIAVWVVERRDF